MDREKFLVVSEHGFLIQLEKGGIERCPHYKGDYQCGRTKRPVRSIDALPKGCPVRTEETAHTICPIVWLLTCASEGIVTSDEAEEIMDGKVKASISAESATEEAGEAPAEGAAAAAGDRRRGDAAQPRSAGRPPEGDLDLGELQNGDGDAPAKPAKPAGRGQKAYAAPPEADRLEEEERQSSIRQDEDRARAMWVEAEAKVRLLDERERRLAAEEAEAAEARKELEARMAELRAKTEELSVKARHADSREQLLTMRATEAEAKEQELRTQAELFHAKARTAEPGDGAGGKPVMGGGHELEALRTALAEREARVAELERIAAVKNEEAERLRAEARDNHEKAVKLLDLVKKKDAKVTAKIMALNKAQLNGTPIPEAEKDDE